MFGNIQPLDGTRVQPTKVVVDLLKRITADKKRISQISVAKKAYVSRETVRDILGGDTTQFGTLKGVCKAADDLFEQAFGYRLIRTLYEEQHYTLIIGNSKGDVDSNHESAGKDEADRFIKVMKRIKADTLMTLSPPISYKPEYKYQPIRFEEYVAYFSPLVNQVLPEAELQWIENPLPYECKNLSEEHQRVIIDKVINNPHRTSRVFNGDKVRMASDITPESIEKNEAILVQKANYYQNIATNGFISWELQRKSSSSSVVKGIDLLRDEDTDALYSLSGSPCSNQIGASCMGITSDNRMINLYQTEGNLESQGLIAPSGSGSADYCDLEETNGDFRKFVIKVAERELLEECGLLGDPKVKVKTILIGFARLMNRAGKPEFFGVSFMNIPFSEINVAKDEIDYVADHRGREIRQDISALKLDIEHMLAKLAESMSFPLYLNLKFLHDFLSTSPDLFLKIKNDFIAECNKTD